MIRNNSHKYSVSAMCAVLQIPRSTYYYEAKEHENNNEELYEQHDMKIDTGEITSKLLNDLRLDLMNILHPNFRHLIRLYVID